MDALKIISEGSIKAERPQFKVGDTVRVDVRIKEGERERIQAFESASRKASASASRPLRAPSLPRSTAASQRPLPSAASLTAWASSVSSLSTAPLLRR